MLLYLLRHSESEGNRDGKFRGRADFPLTERGIRQSEDAAEFLKDKDISRIYSSPLIRSFNTALAIAMKKNLEVFSDKDFNNIYLGNWEGRLKTEIKEKYPKEWEIWTHSPEYLNIKEMETLDDVQRRSVGKVKEISLEIEGNILIVSHRAVIKPLIAGLLNIQKPYFWRLHIDTAALSILEKMEDDRGWMLKNLNINHYLKSFEEERF
ncbi:MAG: phosphoglycerate mutase [bacterium (Candidatus Stahlbacteria) CG23_combo_of_CG06-09_8_20_14_all_34_7]|nr:MAG: phosphoglycerate mutase [bacterium (Candidatus Stahlbacteria) CG23_combo_of_CG06-09_8_20_14_all_34_7]